MGTTTLKTFDFKLLVSGHATALQVDEAPDHRCTMIAEPTGQGSALATDGLGLDNVQNRVDRSSKGAGLNGCQSWPVAVILPILV